ncbi:hypothetical protein EDB80DRAFT_691539 [Ilyonectria destructans]|nr:hypothetical protein EDB80DRAFT_691539 [Ilyonectria destructans]
MSNDMNTSLTARRFVTDYEIIKSIMENLSATDSSRFMYAVRAKMSGYIRNKYMSPIRDFPELKDWLLKMKQAGFTVTMVGRDLETLRRRIMYPWINHNPSDYPLRIWIAVIPPLVKKETPLHTPVSAFSGRDCVHETGALIPWADAQPQILRIQGEPYIEGNSNHLPNPARCGHGEAGYGILSTVFAVPNDHLTPITDIRHHHPEVCADYGWYKCTTKNDNGMIAVFNKKYCTVANPLAVEIREEEDSFNTFGMRSDSDAHCASRNPHEDEEVSISGSSDFLDDPGDGAQDRGHPSHKTASPPPGMYATTSSPADPPPSSPPTNMVPLMPPATTAPSLPPPSTPPATPLPATPLPATPLPATPLPKIRRPGLERTSGERLGRRKQVVGTLGNGRPGNELPIIIGKENARCQVVEGYNR